MTTAHTAPSPPRRAAFQFFVVATIISSLGSGLTMFALAVEAFRRTGDATAVSWLAGAAFLPTVLMTPIGGLLADRWDRRLLMMVGDGGSALALGLVVWRLLDPAGTLVEIGLGVALSAAFAGLTEPAMRATISDLVPPDELDKASGALQLGGASRFLIAPALAGALLVVMPVGGVITLDMGTFAFTMTGALVIRRVLGRQAPRVASSSLWAATREGLAALRTSTLRVLVMLMTVAVFAAGSVQALLPSLVLPIASEVQLGVLTSVAASGMLVGALLVSAIGVRMNLRTGLALGFTAAGVGLVVAGLRPHVILMGVGLLGLFLAMPLINASAEVMLRRSIPNAQLGRAWGLVGLLTQSGAIVAFAAMGLLADNWITPAMLEGGP